MAVMRREERDVGLVMMIFFINLVPEIQSLGGFARGGLAGFISFFTPVLQFIELKKKNSLQVNQSAGTITKFSRIALKLIVVSRFLPKFTTMLSVTVSSAVTHPLPKTL